FVQCRERARQETGCDDFERLLAPRASRRSHSTDAPENVLAWQLQSTSSPSSGYGYGYSYGSSQGSQPPSSVGTSSCAHSTGSSSTPPSPSSPSSVSSTQPTTSMSSRQGSRAWISASSASGSTSVLWSMLLAKFARSPIATTSSN